MTESMNDVIRRGFKRSAAEEPEKKQTEKDVFEMDLPELRAEMNVALGRLEEVQSELGVRIEEAGGASAGEEERRG